LVERFSPPTTPDAPREMKPPCEWKTTMPKTRDGGGIGRQVFCGVHTVFKFPKSAVSRIDAEQ
jgi:hypothetical protein